MRNKVRLKKLEYRKNSVKLSLAILFFFCLFMVPTRVEAEPPSFSKQFTEGGLTAVCEYTYSDNKGERHISILTNTSGKEEKLGQWKVVWTEDSLIGKYGNQTRSRGPDIFSMVFNKVNVFGGIHLKTGVLAEDFLCPEYGYFDTVIEPITRDNEICFDNGNGKCAEVDKDKLTANFSAEKAKKTYDLKDEIMDYVEKWKIDLVDCDAVYEAQIKGEVGQEDGVVNQAIKNSVEEQFFGKGELPTFAIPWIKERETTKSEWYSHINYCREQAERQCDEGLQDQTWCDARLQAYADFNPEEAIQSEKEMWSSLLDTEVDLSHLKDKMSCNTLFDLDENGDFNDPESLGALIQRFLNYIRIAGPILVVLFTMFEFAKAVINSDEEAMKKAQSRLIIRLVAMLALFLLPFLVKEALKFINGLSDPTCYFK